MDKDKIIENLVREVASLMAWRDQAQQVAFPKSSWEHEAKLRGDK